MKHLAFVIREVHKSPSPFFGLSQEETIAKIILLSEEAFKSGFSQVSFFFPVDFWELPCLKEGFPFSLRILKNGDIPPCQETPLVNLGFNFSEKEFLSKVLRDNPNFSFSETEIKNYMHDRGWIEPDLVIITGGIKSIGESLTWSIAYSELFFSPIPWKDFFLEELKGAFEDFSRRERRFGKINE